MILPGVETGPPNYRYTQETVTVSLVKQGLTVSVPQLPPASLLQNPDVCFSLGRQIIDGIRGAKCFSPSYMIKTYLDTVFSKKTYKS